MKLKKEVKRVQQLQKSFGTAYAISAVSAKLFHDDIKYVELAKAYLRRENQDFIDKTRIQMNQWNQEFQAKEEPIRFWTLWWQGYENMPDVVKLCYLTQQNFAKTHHGELVLLTKENIASYITLPPKIIQKVNEQKISLTHLSDIIRVFLIEQYGGAWIDSTLFIDNQLCDSNLEQYDFYSFHLSPERHQPQGTGQIITECKWAGFMLFCKYAHHPIFMFLKSTLMRYWEMHDVIIDYFIMNLLIRILYEDVEDVKLLIDSVDANNPNLYKLVSVINQPFVNEDWDALRCDTSFFKLSWKNNYEKENKEKLTTFYGELCRKYGLR